LKCSTFLCTKFTGFGIWIFGQGDGHCDYCSLY
jgi:hypothetical protein